LSFDLDTDFSAIASTGRRASRFRLRVIGREASSKKRRLAQDLAGAFWLLL
jgi:hypothetical protein